MDWKLKRIVAALRPVVQATDIFNDGNATYILLGYLSMKLHFGFEQFLRTKNLRLSPRN